MRLNRWWMTVVLVGGIGFSVLGCSSRGKLIDARCDNGRACRIVWSGREYQIGRC